MSPPFGFRHTPSARARMTAAHTGKRHSPEVRAKISAGNIGLKLGLKASDAAKAKMSASRRGKRFTSEHCDALSQALLDFYQRTHPPLSPAERARREARRIYKRDLREQRRRGRVRRHKEKS